MNYDAANAFLKQRLNMPTSLKSLGISSEVHAAVRAHCFFSARVAEAHVLERLRDVSDRYSRGEVSLAMARGELKTYLAGQGHDPDAKGTSALASTARLNLILRQNAAMANAVGQYQVGRDPDIEARWPNWRYIAMSGARDSHAAWSGRVFRKSDPIWQRIFPPWEFNCRCQVEDCDDEEAKQYGGVIQGMPVPDVPASGFQFDPAEAFTSMDTDAIKDVWWRAEARSAMEIEFGDQLQGSGSKLKIEPHKYQTWQDRGLTSAREWTDVSSPPPLIEAEKGRAMLEAGIEAVDPDGRTVKLDHAILEHWEKDGVTPKLQSDIDGRLRAVNWAVETVKAPNERWTQEAQSVYVTAFQKETGGYRGCLVAVTDDNKARTYMIKDLGSLDKARKGLSCRTFSSNGEAAIEQAREVNRERAEITARLKELRKKMTANGATPDQLRKVDQMLKQAKPIKYIPGTSGKED